MVDEVVGATQSPFQGGHPVPVGHHDSITTLLLLTA